MLTRDGGDHNVRCIHCAFTAAERAAGDLEIRTRSGGAGAAVVLRRKASAWSAEPSTAVFMILPEEGGECLDRHQSFADEAELRGSTAGRDVKAYTIGQVAEMLAAGRPK